MIWGIIGALDAEIKLIKDKMQVESETKIYGSTFYKGKVYGQDVVLVCCSVGTINATICAQTVIREFGADVVVNVGIAGAMDKKLSLKVSVPYTNYLKCDYVVIIEDYLYSIFHVDPDKTKGKTYIYLEGMRSVER